MRRPAHAHTSHEVRAAAAGRAGSTSRGGTGREHVVEPERGVERRAVLDGRGDDGRVVGHAVQRVHEVHPRLVTEVAQHRVVGVDDVEPVPLHLRDLRARRDPADRAGDHVEPGGASFSSRRGEQHLHADADPEERSAGRDRVVRRAARARPHAARPCTRRTRRRRAARRRRRRRPAPASAVRRASAPIFSSAFCAECRLPMP